MLNTFLSFGAYLETAYYDAGGEVVLAEDLVASGFCSIFA